MNLQKSGRTRSGQWQPNLAEHEKNKEAITCYIGVGTTEGSRLPTRQVEKPDEWIESLHSLFPPRQPRDTMTSSWPT